MNAIGIVSCIGFVVVLLGLGVFVRARRAHRSKWSDLCSRYPDGARSAERHFDQATATINGVVYPRQLDIGLNGAGIRIAFLLPFRAFHRPMFVPWDDVTPARVQPDGELPLRVGESADITLSGKAALAAGCLLARRLEPSRKP